MAIALRGTVQTATASSHTVSVNKPAGVVSGDLILIGITGYGTGGAGAPSTPSTPSGFAAVPGTSAGTSAASGYTGSAWFYRVSDGTEGASFSCTTNGGDVYIDCECAAYSGADTSTPFNINAQTAVGTGGSATVPNIGSTSVDGCWHLVRYAAYNSLTSNPPTGYTQDAFYDTANELDHKVITTAGATGAPAVGAGTNGWVAMACAIQPPTSGGTATATHGSDILPVRRIGPFTWPPVFPFTGQATGGTAYLQTLTGSAGTPTGGLIKAVSVTETGAGTPAGALVKADSQVVAGSGGTPAGALLKSDSKLLSGSAGTPTGALVKLVAQLLAGSAGTPAGALSQIKAVLQTLTGSAGTPSGALVKQAQLIKTGSAGTPAGGLLHTVSKLVAGAVTPVGALLKAVSQLLTGSAGTPAGALSNVRAALQTLTGSIASAGALLKSATKVLTGSAGTPSGAHTKAVSQTVTGSITPTGAVLKVVSKLLAGAVSTITGALSTSTGAAVPEHALTLTVRDKLHTVKIRGRLHTATVRDRWHTSKRREQR